MLYLVATPIGNLSDISLRALKIMRAADFVVSEDTRKTGRLLAHFEISKLQTSFHAFNEYKTLPRLIRLLKEGKMLALVSNAGTPAISDPGFSLVRVALAEGLEISAVPGPTALITALTLSGLPISSFIFRGFPPRKSSARRRFFSEDAEMSHTLVFYESPHRLLASLADALVVFGDRQAALANDLTKKFEHVYRGSISHIIREIEGQKLLGEYTLVVEGKHA